ncbi:hypothetical protein H0H92_001987 [Tricholoma furcatifolium]|nr:hypothetical protein H0H92_001987 [Tricholoma furcatifolium]
MAYLYAPSNNWPWPDWNDHCVYPKPISLSSLDSPQSLFSSSPSPVSTTDDMFTPPPSVKEEPDDPVSCFIMELSAPNQNSSTLAPPTEVPLRATQASSDMRRMMTVFRLNPFAMHSGGCRGTLPNHQESAHPLESEPVTFEFQLDLEPGILDPDYSPSLNNPDLRSFSPNFDLHDKFSDDEPDHQTSWSTTSTDPAQDDLGRFQSQPLQTWDFTYPDVEQSFSSINSNHITSRRPPRLTDSIVTSHSYLQKAAAVADEPAEYISSEPPGIHYPSTVTSPNHPSHRGAAASTTMQLAPQGYQPATTGAVLTHAAHTHTRQAQAHWDSSHHSSSSAGGMRSAGAGYHTCASAASQSPTTSYADVSRCSHCIFPVVP